MATDPRAAFATDSAPRSEIGVPGWWSFWIADQDLQVWNKQRIILKIPPQSVETHRPIRAQVSQDLARKAVVVLDGQGLVRWTLSGTHGVGVSHIEAFGTRGQVSGGLKARYELLDLFQTWVDQNLKLTQSGEPLLRLILTISDGGPSEVPFEEWEIMPDEIPRDRRSSSTPMAWNWSLSFWGIAELTNDCGITTRDFLHKDQVEVLEAADAGLAAVEGALSKPSLLDRLGALVKKVRAFLRGIRAIRAAIAAALAAGKRLLTGLGDLALGLVSSITGILNDVQVFFRDVRDYVRGFAREVRDQVIKARYIMGELSRASRRPWDRSMPQSYPVARATSVPIRPGDSLQSIALRVYNDAARWSELVALNGLDYPYLDCSGPGFGPNPALVAAGRRVLGAGDALKLPLVGGLERPADPIGWDRDESGSNALVGGKENMAASLLRRLRTATGWLPYHADYGAGINRHLGTPLTLAGILGLRRDVASALRLDPRVLSVVSVKAYVNGDAVWVDAEVETPLGLVSLAGSLV